MSRPSDRRIGACKYNDIAGFTGIYRDRFSKTGIARRRPWYIYFEMTEYIINKTGAIETCLRATVGVIIVFS